MIHFISVIFCDPEGLSERSLRVSALWALKVLVAHNGYGLLLLKGDVVFLRQERRGVFETNSSSTHSICIASKRPAELKYPSRLFFRCDDFGWERKYLYDPEDKAAYLYASFLELYSRKKASEVMAFITDVLYSVGVKCEFETPVYWQFNGEFYIQNAGVDHCGSDDHRKFVDLTTGNERRLLRFLFSADSFVITGNDNGKGNVDINVTYPHEEYYKGN